MWVIDDVRIYVQKLPEEGGQTVVRLQPLTGGTVFQTFGYENTVYKVSCVVVGSGDLSRLKSKARDGTTHVLSGAYGYRKTGYIKSISADPRMIISQSIRTDLNCTDPVYDVSLEIHET
jgi:hypothetical protein